MLGVARSVVGALLIGAVLTGVWLHDASSRQAGVDEGAVRRSAQGATAALDSVTPGAGLPGTSSTEAVSDLPGEMDEGSSASRSVDVVVYGTTTAGIGAVRGLERAAEAFGGPLEVAVISDGDVIQSPLAQGLSVEDSYGDVPPDHGFYGEFRRLVIEEYGRAGIRPFAEDGSFVYEPQVADRVLRSFLKGRTHVSWTVGRVFAGHGGERKYVLVEEADGKILRIETRFIIDASPEGDLGRLLGADYMIGLAQDVYNDRDGPLPPEPTAEDGWMTAPQRMSMLLTLEVAPDGRAPAVASLDHRLYDASTYDPGMEFGDHHLEGFRESWSMEHILPNGKRELNEPWSDYFYPVTSFAWVMEPEHRGYLMRQMATHALNRVRYLQENGYPDVGVDRVPQWPYVRDGVRFVGNRVYTGGDIDAWTVENPIAKGSYARYDRHDHRKASMSVDRAAIVHVPMAALMPVGHPFLLSPTAISSDESAYSSAVRMEPVRGNMGAAAGVIVAVADALGADAHSAPYEAVRRELVRQGHELDW